MLRLVMAQDAAPRAGAPASERLRHAWQRRHETDYELDFPSALGWFVLTGGLYGFFVLYHLLRRAREHNRRRVELLDAATTFAWDEARARGLNEELRALFERIAEQMRALDELKAEFRDPALWLVFVVATLGFALLPAWISIDRDLTRHEAAERAIEIDLAFVYSRMGAYLAPPAPAQTKPRQRAARRVVATVLTLGWYGAWWVRDLTRDGNVHFAQNWRFEDDLADAARSLMLSEPELAPGPA